MKAAVHAMTLGLICVLAGCAGPDQGRGSGHGPGPGGPGEVSQGADQCQALFQGPGRTPHGPLSNADFNRDGTVTQAELARFMNDGEYRRVTLLAYFDRFDTDRNAMLSVSEFAKVDPPFSFNGVDANADCVVTRSEVVAYVDQPGRSYRKLGLLKFFELVDADHDGNATPAETEAAHQSGLLAR
jgi:hypothetical protein